MKYRFVFADFDRLFIIPSERYDEWKEWIRFERGDIPNFALSIDFQFMSQIEFENPKIHSIDLFKNVK